LDLRGNILAPETGPSDLMFDEDAAGFGGRESDLPRENTAIFIFVRHCVTIHPLNKEKQFTGSPREGKLNVLFL